MAFVQGVSPVMPILFFFYFKGGRGHAPDAPPPGSVPGVVHYSDKIYIRQLTMDISDVFTVCIDIMRTIALVLLSTSYF
jgi:hypothetical protein